MSVIYDNFDVAVCHGEAQMLADPAVLGVATGQPAFAGFALSAHTAPAGSGRADAWPS